MILEMPQTAPNNKEKRITSPELRKPGMTALLKIEGHRGKLQ
jgi:hypothetical protein